MLRFNNETIKLLKKFLEALSEEINNEDFEVLRVAYPLPLCDGYVISVSSSECNELTIEIFTDNGKNIGTIAKLSVICFKDYFKAFIYDVFLYTRYIDIEEKSKIVEITDSVSRIKFEVKLNRKLQINNDME